MKPFRDYVDMAANFSGGAYVGLSTITVLGLAVSEYVAGSPVTVVGPDGRNIVYMVHHAPEWFVGTIGIYTVILGLFWMGRPINTYVNAKAAEKGVTPAPEPIPGGETVPIPDVTKPGG